VNENVHCHKYVKQRKYTWVRRPSKFFNKTLITRKPKEVENLNKLKKLKSLEFRIIEVTLYFIT